MKTPTLESPRLVLNAITEDDAEAVLAGVDAEVQRFIPVPLPYAREHAEHYVTVYAAVAAAGDTSCLWAIRENETLIGALELKSEPPGSANVGYWMAPQYRGRGLMTEAVARIVEFAFDPVGLDLDRVSWEAVAGNIGSARVVQRNGFTFEGPRRLGLVHRDARVDGWFASLLRSDPREPKSGWPS